MVELFINNRKIDIDTTQAITINKSFDKLYFFGYANVNSYSYSFKLPGTLNNKSVLAELANEMTARLVVDNIVLLDGYCVVKKLNIGKDASMDKYYEYTCNIYTKGEKSLSDLFNSLTDIANLKGYEFSRDIDPISLINEKNNKALEIAKNGGSSDVSFPYILNGYPNAPYDEFNYSDDKRWNKYMNYFECVERNPSIDEIPVAFNAKQLIKNAFETIGLKVDGSFFEDKTTDNIWINGKTLDNALYPRLKFDFNYKSYEVVKSTQNPNIETVIPGTEGEYEAYVCKKDASMDDSHKLYGWKTLMSQIAASRYFKPNYLIDTHTMIPNRNEGVRTIVVKKSGWYHIKLDINKLKMSPKNHENSYYSYDARFANEQGNNVWSYGGVMNKLVFNGMTVYLDNGSLYYCPVEFQLRRNWKSTEGDESDDMCGTYKSNRLMNVGTHTTETPTDNVKTIGGVYHERVDNYIRCAQNAVINNDENCLLGMRFGQARNQDVRDFLIRHNGSDYNKITAGKSSLFFIPTEGHKEMYHLNRLSDSFNTNQSAMAWDYTDEAFQNSACAIYNVNSYSLFENYKKYNVKSEYEGDTLVNSLEITDDGVIDPYTMLGGFKKGNYTTLENNPYPNYERWINGTQPIYDGVENASADTIVWLEEGDVIDLVAYLPLCQSWMDLSAEGVDRINLTRGYVSIDELDAAIDMQCVSYEQDWMVRNTQQLTPTPNMAQCLIQNKPTDIINSLTNLFNLNLYTIGTNVVANGKGTAYLDMNGNYKLRPIDISQWCDVAIEIENSISTTSASSSSDTTSVSNTLFDSISEFYGYVDEVKVQSPFGKSDMSFDGNYDKGYASTIQHSFVYPHYDYVSFGTRVDAFHILDGKAEDYLFQLKTKSKKIPFLVENSLFDKIYYDVDQWFDTEKTEYDKTFVFGYQYGQKIQYTDVILLVPRNDFPFDLSFNDVGSSILTRYYKINGAKETSTNGEELRRLYQTYTINAMLPMHVYNEITKNQYVIINGDKYYVTAIEKMNINSNENIIQGKINLKLIN